jgi:predicted amidophosphoribosyltransferase
MLGIPYEPGAMEKSEITGTQTDKSRILRWRNVEGVFWVADPGILEGKHILLVDDVVTTGSTLEACATEILKVGGTRVSIATMGVSMKVF